MESAQRILAWLLDSFTDSFGKDIVIISGATALGVPLLAYEVSTPAAGLKFAVLVVRDCCAIGGQKAEHKMCGNNVLEMP